MEAERWARVYAAVMSVEVKEWGGHWWEIVVQHVGTDDELARITLDANAIFDVLLPRMQARWKWKVLDEYPDVYYCEMWLKHHDDVVAAEQDCFGATGSTVEDACAEAMALAVGLA